MFHWFSGFVCFNFIDFCSYIIIFFQLILSFFYFSWGGTFLTWEFNAINVLFSFTVAVTQNVSMLYFHFLSVWCIFKFPLRSPLWLLGNLQVYCLASKFEDFHISFQLLIWVKKHSLISILLNLLMFVLWPKIWSILVYVPCTHVFCCFELVFCTCKLDVVYWCWVICLLFFCLVFLSVVEKRMKSPPIIVVLSISSFSSISFASHILQLCCFISVFLVVLFFYFYVTPFLFLVIFFALTAMLSDTNSPTPTFD